MTEVFVDLRFFPDLRKVGETVARWEELGVAGVNLGDHIFPPTAHFRDPVANRGADQLTMLTVILTLSQRLRVASVASNVGFQHPLFLIRKFATLAVLYGSDRVYAGFGAGWAKREFEAIGIAMPPHARRLDRLEEALQLARALFDEGWADLDGDHVVAHELPLAPKPETPPRLLVGGGSERLIRLAGRYCDHIDLNAPSHRRSRVEPHRKLMTTVADLEQSIATLREEEAAAGRAPGSVTTSVVLTNIAFCRESEIEAETERICAAVELPAAIAARQPVRATGRTASGWRQRSASGRSGSPSAGSRSRSGTSSASSPTWRRCCGDRAAAAAPRAQAGRLPLLAGPDDRHLQRADGGDPARVAGSDDRRHVPPRDRRRPWRALAVPVGVHGIPAVLDGDGADLRPVGRHLRPAAAVLRVDPALPARLGALRARAEHDAADRLPRHPGPRRRRRDPACDGDHGPDRPTAGARPLRGADQLRVPDRGAARTGRRRPDRGQCELALDLLRQPSDRRPRAARDRADDATARAHEAASRRLRRRRAARGGYERVAAGVALGARARDGSHGRRRRGCVRPAHAARPRADRAARRRPRANRRDLRPRDRAVGDGAVRRDSVRPAVRTGRARGLRDLVGRRADPPDGGRGQRDDPRRPVGLAHRPLPRQRAARAARDGGRDAAARVHGDRARRSPRSRCSWWSSGSAPG